MEREPLDSDEYESTYLELRPARELLIVTTDGSILARHEATMRVDPGAVAANGRLVATDEILLAPPGPPTALTTCPDLTLEVVDRSGTEAVHLADARPDRPLQVTHGRCPDVARTHLTSLRRPRSWRLLRSGLLVVVSGSLGIVAELEPRAARGLFVAICGVLMLGWVWLTRRATPPNGPFCPAVTRVVDW